MAAKTTRVELAQAGHRAPKIAAPKSTKKAPKAAEQAADDSFLTKFPAGELGNMQCYQYTHGQAVAFNSAYGWLFYSPEDRYWLSGDLAESKIDKSIINLLLDRQRRAAAESNDAIASKALCTSRSIGSVRSLLKPYVTALPSEFDTDPNLLNTRSGVIDLRTGKIVADESSKFTYCVPTKFEPDIDYSSWMTWLDSTVQHHESNEEMREWLQMAVGYSLTGHSREECMFFLYGPTRSGKGTLTSTLLALMGKPLSATTNFSAFTRVRDGSNFDLAPLKAARLVVASEGKDGQRMNEATVKTITGRDYIRCSFKGKDEFDYLPQFKIWLASNYAVSANADDDAFWARMKVLHFPWSKADTEDKEMKDRMAHPDYLRLVLAYGVYGAKMWFNSPRGLITPKCVRESVNEHREACDSIGQWLAGNCTDSVKSDHFVATIRLYADYENWCEANGFQPKKGKAFAVAMKSHGYEAKKTERANGWLGLDLLYKAA